MTDHLETTLPATLERRLAVLERSQRTRDPVQACQLPRSADQVVHHVAERGLIHLEERMRPTDTIDGLIKDYASRQALAERVEGDGRPEHAAIAQHDVAVHVTNDDRSGLLEPELEDVTPERCRFHVLVDDLALDRKRRTGREVGEGVGELDGALAEERLVEVALARPGAEMPADDDVVANRDSAQVFLEAVLERDGSTVKDGGMRRHSERHHHHHRKCAGRRDDTSKTHLPTPSKSETRESSTPLTRARRNRGWRYFPMNWSARARAKTEACSPRFGCGNMCSHDEPRERLQPLPACSRDGEPRARPCDCRRAAEDRCRGSRRDAARDRTRGTGVLSASGDSLAREALRRTPCTSRPGGDQRSGSCARRAAAAAGSGERDARRYLPEGGAAGRCARVHALTAPPATRRVGRDKQTRPRPARQRQTGA